MIVLLKIRVKIMHAYDNFNCAFDFLPGEAGGIYPAKRHDIPSVFIPFTNLIE